MKNSWPESKEHLGPTRSKLESLGRGMLPLHQPLCSTPFHRVVSHVTTHSGFNSKSIVPPPTGTVALSSVAFISEYFAGISCLAPASLGDISALL